MMRKGIIKALFGIGLTIFTLGVGTHSADAKRRFRMPSKMPVVVPIPRVSSQPQVDVVKVRDLPDTPAFQLDDGTYVDLGFHFIGETGGDWVGYIGSSKDYLTLSVDQLSGIMRLSGMESLPPEPKRRSQSYSGSGGSGGLGWMFWVIVGAAILGFRFLKGLIFGVGKVAARATARSGSGAAGSSEWLARAESRMASAGAAGPSPDRVRAAATGTARSSGGSASRSSTVVRGGRVSFGG